MTIDQLKEDITQLVAYNYRDELDDFHFSEDGPKDMHIFRVIARLAGFVEGHTMTAEELEVEAFGEGKVGDETIQG